MPSSNQKYYSRFIPSEEVGAVTQWKFGAVDGSDPVLEEPEPELLVEAPVVDEAAQLALIQQTHDEAFAQGFAQGQSDTALEWQQRMDAYVANQGAALVERLSGVVDELGASLDQMQQHMAQDVLALACDIAREVIRRELSVNTDALQPVIREAVGMLVAEGRPSLVRMHPGDMDALGQSLRDELGAASAVQWVADPAVVPGGCLVESGGSVIDGSLSKRWERAIASLGLKSPWQEGADDVT